MLFYMYSINHGINTVSQLRSIRSLIVIRYTDIVSRVSFSLIKAYGIAYTITIQHVSTVHSGEREATANRGGKLRKRNA